MNISRNKTGYRASTNRFTVHEHRKMSGSHWWAVQKTRAHNMINVLVSCSFDDSGNFGQIPLEHLLFNYVGIWLVGSIVWFDRLFSHALHSIALFFYNIETTLTEMSCDECAFRTECFHMLSVTYQKLPFSHVQYICSCVTSFFLSHVN